MTIPPKILNYAAREAATRLLGCELQREIDGNLLRGRIVETEAYDQSDVASHSYRGETERTKVMFGDPGHLYVYFTYGMHFCCNIVVGPSGYGAAVLIRALEPVEGEEMMLTRRGGRGGVELTNGPAKLCQAFEIDKRLNGHDLHQPPLKLIIKPQISGRDIVQTTRIGISEAKELPWRFYIRINQYISRL